jgi:hypothetical protein
LDGVTMKAVAIGMGSKEKAFKRPAAAPPAGI